jgi:hypothetical protein
LGALSLSLPLTETHANMQAGDLIKARKALANAPSKQPPAAMHSTGVRIVSARTLWHYAGASPPG